jgi:hypothetical protein
LFCTALLYSRFPFSCPGPIASHLTHLLSAGPLLRRPQHTGRVKNC